MKKILTKGILCIIISALVIGVLEFFNEDNVEAKKVSLSKKNMTINVGKSTTIKIKNVKSRKIKKVTWKSSSKRIAKVSKRGKNGARVKGISAGKCKIMCAAVLGKKKYKLSCTVKIREVKKPIKSQPQISNHDENKSKPKFIGIKAVNGRELKSEGLDNQMIQEKINISNNVDDLNNYINIDEIVILKLSYENEKRDSIVEIVLNDSDYGKKQIYTTAATTNKILSSDTYYDETKGVYITDLTLLVPSTLNSVSRTIDIEEAVFLRETTGVKGYVDMSYARKRKITLGVSQKLIPSISDYFEFSENGEGYTLTSVNNRYKLPRKLYIPPQHNGKPVTRIASTAFAKTRLDTLIVPESVKRIDNNMGGESFMVQDIWFLGSPVLEKKDLGVANKEKLKLVVPQDASVHYFFMLPLDYRDYVFYEKDGEVLNVRNTLHPEKIDLRKRQNIFFQDPIKIPLEELLDENFAIEDYSSIRISLEFNYDDDEEIDTFDSFAIGIAKNEEEYANYNSDKMKWYSLGYTLSYDTNTVDITTDEIKGKPYGLILIALDSRDLSWPKCLKSISINEIEMIP